MRSQFLVRQRNLYQHQRPNLPIAKGLSICHFIHLHPPEDPSTLYDFLKMSSHRFPLAVLIAFPQALMSPLSSDILKDLSDDVNSMNGSDDVYKPRSTAGKARSKSADTADSQGKHSFVSWCALLEITCVYVMSRFHHAASNQEQTEA